MEETISQFSKTTAAFCNHLQSSCDALKQSVDRRPIPLDSASSTFIQCLNRRIASASSDLNLLELMSFGTVSFEELLGHCNEVYKNNQNRILEIQDRLGSFGYVPEVEIDEVDLNTPMAQGFDLKDELDPYSAYNGPVSVASSIMKSLEEDPLMDESLSLKSLGLSDVCLATLASEGSLLLLPDRHANSKMDDPDISMKETIKCYGDNLHNMKSPDQDAANMGVIEGELKPAEALRAFVKASKDDYESLPSYVKSLTSWELKLDIITSVGFLNDSAFPSLLSWRMYTISRKYNWTAMRFVVLDLLIAVEKINSSLKNKDKTEGSNYFRQDEIESMDLGLLRALSFSTLEMDLQMRDSNLRSQPKKSRPKARTYLLLLIRMNRLAIEATDGLISYEVL
ncbi:unnamed protein product [Dovyalis caffra]|uniref:Spindle and kinetochore-associated protein 3 n=1 Tax=Dovyalis caffra TaxID=77055 RepID=A0AAV1RZ78_9ROSI|nr:unnamed protein product [Dovyalis caffra]